MSEIQPLGRTSHRAYTRLLPHAGGFALPGQAAGPAAPPSGAARAVGGLLGLQEARLRGHAVAAAMPYPRRAWPGAGGTGATGVGATGAGCGFVASGYGRFIGRSSGSGQCVALVKAASPEIGPTRTWAPGAPVQRGAGPAPGTVIATFDRSGRYANATDGSSHAAIYLGQDERGIQVLDQWSGSPAAVRTIAWDNPSGKAANTAGSFRVVARSA